MDQQLLTQALACAHHMADLARPVARATWLQPKDVSFKDDGSFLTRADLAIERSWRDHLRTAFPTHAIQGEEYGSDAGQAGYTWVLDPIDGTRQYGMGLGNFSTLIALCDAAGYPLMGMIDLPLMDARYFAVRGQGAWLNNRRITVSTTTDLGTALTMLANQNSFAGAEAGAYERLRGAVGGTAFDAGSPAYGALAAGKVDLCLNGGDLNAHDICALVPVIEEAGGIITNWQGGALGLASSGAIVAAATADLHQAALAVLAE
ncbi:histidinol phosphate phosphatase [Epibacterium ulvae]|uniref:inositol monophosphatase family protein n=1 Tax=Epibacterium ulvae TaxID=1156985 RepID=UPI001BFCAA02|nr:inositol monophosphatase family protein [Epibacterium ulvae]MBT8154254.1 histidinol phosphate phosphatase [Epibacterium ulvae]